MILINFIVLFVKKESWFIMMVGNMKESGKTIFNLVEDMRFIQMEIIMKDILSMDNLREWVPIIG